VLAFFFCILHGMRAAIINQFGAPGVFQIKDVPVPGIKDNQVLVRMKAASVNPVDWKHRYGNHRLLLGAKFPIILGYDGAGIIEKTGKQVRKFRCGDKVYFRSDKKYGGTYAQYAATSEKSLCHIPEGLDFSQAAAIPLAALTALQALRDKGHISRGKKVLINGAASGVGHFAVQIARHYQCVCYAVASEKHKPLINVLQPDHYFDYTKENYLEKPGSYDIIFDAVGTDSFIRCREKLHPGGVYITTLPRLKLLGHRLLSAFTKHKRIRTLIMKPLGDDMAFINDLIKNESFFVHIDQTFRLEEIVQAHEYSEKGHAEGKIVILIE
jgi:NADPH:quinone reductase-like Zn-dependent oxidoreductase